MKLSIQSAVVLVILGAAGASSFGQDRRSSELPGEYDVISERNMFLRERQRPRPPSSRSERDRPPEAPPERPETRFVLRGVVIEDAELRAYFENTRGGSTQVRPGDSIASGHIVEIAIDAVAYEADGQLTWVEVGQNLTGARATHAASGRSSSNSASTSAGGGSSGASTPTTGPTTGPSAPASGNISDVEERMRQRARERNRR